MAANNTPCGMTMLPEAADSMNMDHSMHMDMSDATDSKQSHQMPCCDSMANCNMASCMALIHSIAEATLPVAIPSNTLSEPLNTSLPNSQDSLYRPPILS